MTHRALRKAAPKSLFSSVYAIGKTRFDECFLLHVITARHYFHKSLSSLWGNFKDHVDAFVETSALNKDCVLCVISTITV